MLEKNETISIQKMLEIVLFVCLLDMTSFSRRFTVQTISISFYVYFPTVQQTRQYVPFLRRACTHTHKNKQNKEVVGIAEILVLHN